MSKNLDLFTSRVYRKSRSNSSVRTYVSALKLFIEFLGFNDLDELVEAIKVGKVNVEQSVNSWLDRLDSRECSPQTQGVYVAAVKKLVQICVPNQTVNWKRVDLPRLWRVEEDRIPSKQELKEIMFHGGLEDKVIITFKASSGVRDITLVNLKVGNVDLDSYEDVGVVIVKPMASKQRIGYVTFITPEAKNFLRSYLDMRRRRGEKVTVDSPLITGSKSRPIQESGIRQRWKRLLKKSGKNEKVRSYHVFRFHTLRKFFRTSLEVAGVSKSFREKMMGHKGEYMDDAYFKPHLEMILAEYRKAIPNLTIMEEVKYEQMMARQLLNTAKVMGLSEDKLKRLEEILARTKSVDEAVEEFKRLKDEEFTSSDNGSYINGNGYRAKVISEVELIAHVEHGWDVVKELSEGKFIVRKQTE